MGTTRGCDRVEARTAWRALWRRRIRKVKRRWFSAVHRPWTTRLISRCGLPKLGSGLSNWQRILIDLFREAGPKPIEYSERTADHISQQIVQREPICVNL